jgi:hypothetical protein
MASHLRTVAARFRAASDPRDCGVIGCIRGPIAECEVLRSGPVLTACADAHNFVINEAGFVRGFALLVTFL